MSEVKTTIRLTDQASSVLRSIATQAKQTQSSMEQTGRAIDNAFKTNTPNTFATAAGNALNRISSAAEELGNLVDSMFDDVDTGFADDIERGVRTAGNAVNDFIDTADSAGRALDEVGSSAEDLGKTVDGIGRNNGLEELENDADEAGDEMEDAAGKALTLEDALKKMAAAIGVAAIAKQVKDFVSDAISLGTEYTAMMSEVAAISGATGSEYEMLEQTAREYGATTVFSASEAAEALKYMSLAGWDANQSASALGGVLDLAAASGMGLGEASDMVTDYLSAFGMAADQAGYFADLLAYAQANSNTSAQQLGEAFLNSAANMNAAGQDIETTTALIEAMSNQGTKGARAGTQLAAIMRDITNQMEDGAIQIGNMSIAVQDQQGNFRDLTDILTDVEAAVDGMGSAQKSAALATTFTADSTKGINQILTEGMHNIARYEEELRNSTDTAAKTADIMNDNLKGDLASMNSAFEEMQLQVFEGMEGTLRDGVQYVTNTVIPTLTEWIPGAVEGAVDAISAIGNALKPAFEWLIKNPKTVGTALTAIATALISFKALSGISNIISGVGTSLSNLGSIVMNHPIIAAAAGIAAAVIAIKLAIDEYNEAMAQANLEAHFGSISLSDSQISELAGRILDVDWVVNINAALGHINNAEQMQKQAEDELRKQKEILWEAQVYTMINPDPNENYEQQISGIKGTIQTTLDQYREDTGLKYRPFALIELNPTGETDEYGNPSIVQVLIDYANLAIKDDQTELEHYTRDVVVAAMGVDPATPEGTVLTASLVGAVNAAVQGDTTALKEYARDVTLAMLGVANPGTDIVSGLAGAVNSAITGDTTKLSEYIRNTLAAIGLDTTSEGGTDLLNGLISGVNTAIAGDDTVLTKYLNDTLAAIGLDTTSEDGAALLAGLVRGVNEAITGDTSTLNKYTRDINTLLGIKADDKTMENVVGLVNAAITGDTSKLLTYSRAIATDLYADYGEEGEGNASLVANLVETINAAIKDDKTDLNTYSRNVAMALTHNTEDNLDEDLLENIVGVANAVIEGDHDKLSDFTDNVLLYLTPEEGGRFLRALATLTSPTSELMTKKLAVKPEFEDKVYVKLSPQMQEEFKTSISNFVDDQLKALQEQSLGAQELVQGIIGDKNLGQGMINQIQQWAANDQINLQELSAALSTLVSEALRDGILTADEQESINAMQQKISNIISGWQASQAEAEWQMIELKWTGIDLTPESFTSLMQEMTNQRTTAMQSLDTGYTSLLGMINNWNSAGYLAGDQYDAWMEAVTKSYIQKQSDSFAREMSFINNTIRDAYQDAINEAVGGLGSSEIIPDVATDFEKLFNAGDIQELVSRVYNEYLDAYKGAIKDPSTKAAVESIWETMIPEVSGMQTTIDRARELGGQVSTEFFNEFERAMEVGAAVGDKQASYYMMAKGLIENLGSDFVQAIAEDETMREALPKALMDAIDQALWLAQNSTDEEINIDGIINYNPEVVTAEDEASMREKVGEAAQTAAELAQRVVSFFTPSFWQPITETAQVVDGESDENLYLKVSAAAESMRSRAQAAASSFVSNVFHGIFMSTTITDGTTTDNTTNPAASTPTGGVVDVTYTLGSVNSDDIYEQAGGKLTEAFSENFPVDNGLADITLTLNSDNSDEIYQQVGDNLETAFSVMYEKDGSAQINLSESDNSSWVYDKVGQALDTAFAVPFNVYGTVNAWLTVDYNIVNPSKNVLFTGAASGTGTISAMLYAEGGLVTEPELAWVGEAGYPEYIIPMNGSQDSLAMWREAGEMLGAFDAPIQTVPSGDSLNSGGIQGTSRDINLNINGSGRIQVQGGASREEVADYILANLRDYIIDMIEEEILTEGEGVHAY